MTDVLTYHNDIARTGQILHEEVLSPSNVNTNQFGLLWTLPVDEKVLAQPLYAAGVTIPGAGMRNVLYVETENATAYAFDADSTNLLWRTSLVGCNEQAYVIAYCTIVPELGVTATPVIDRQFGSNGAIFIQSMSQDTYGNAHQRLHALDLATGEEQMAPVEISGCYPGLGSDSDGTNDVFAAANYYERAALMLQNGVIYTFWSAHCNSQPATSWVIAYNEADFSQAGVIDLQPNSTWGSIWNSGTGPSADSDGNIYVAVGNGTGSEYVNGLNNDGFPVDGDYAQSLVKLTMVNNTLQVVDYFAMSNVTQESSNDWDLGSGGTMVLPDMTDTNGVTQQLVIAGGKDENIYIADRWNMGKWNPSNNDTLYEELPGAFTGNGTNSGPPNPYGRTGGLWSMPCYFNGSLYYGPVNGPVTQYTFHDAVLSKTPTSVSPTIYGYPGANPCVSANGCSNGVVWAVETVGKGDFFGIPYKSAVLHAYAATNLANELYNSEQLPGDRDGLGTVNDFVTPMIASGRVYVANSQGIGVFGLLNSSSLTPLQQWRNEYFGNPSNVGAGANHACPAGDGVPNLIKYAIGLNPLIPVTGTQLGSASVLQYDGQDHLAVTLNRNADPPDVGIIAEVSSDVLSWAPNSSGTTVLTNTPAQLVIMDNASVGVSINQYMRLLVYPISGF